MALAIKLAVLTSYDAQVVMLGTKPFVNFTMEFSEPLDQPYYTTFEVTYNTPTGVQTVGYMVITPAGTTGPVSDMNPFLRTWTMTSYTMVASGPYIE